MEKTNNIFHSTVLIALFAATAIALGYALVSVPNVELITATLFISGMVIGWKKGVYVAVITYTVFSVFNPFGFPGPFLLIAQIAGGLIAVITGTLSKRYNNPFYFFLSGFLVTILYDIFTNIAGYFMYVSKQTFWAYMIGGISFSLIHIVSNILIFVVLLYPLRGEFKKFSHG